MLHSYFSCDICELWLTNQESEEYGTGYGILPTDKLAVSYLPWQRVCSGHPRPDGHKKADAVAKASEQHNSSWSGREGQKMRGREGKKPGVKAVLSFPFGRDTNLH